MLVAEGREAGAGRRPALAAARRAGVRRARASDAAVGGLRDGRGRRARPRVWGRARAHGRRGDLQWHCDPGVRGLARRRGSPAPTWCTRTCSAPGGRPGRGRGRGSAGASEHNGLAWPGEPPWAAMAEVAGRIDRFYAHGPGARAGACASGCARTASSGVSPVEGLAPPAAGLPSPRIVFTGRLSPDKGPDVLIDAVARMTAPPPLLILGAGRARDGAARADRRGGPRGRRAVLGWVADPAPWVAGAPVQACPSRDEAFSQAAVLAMGLGVPVVGTRVDGFPETLAGGRGLVVEPDDPEALAAALEDVLFGGAAGPAVGARVGAAVRHRAGRLAVRARPTRSAPVAAQSSPPERFGVDPREPSLHAWHVLAPCWRGGYLPWTTGSMRPQAGRGLQRDRPRRPDPDRRVRHGVSTVVLARLLRERRARLCVALEHDRHWAALVGDQLRREALDTIAASSTRLCGRAALVRAGRTGRGARRGRPARRRRPAGARPRSWHPPRAGAAVVRRAAVAGATVMLDDISRPASARSSPAGRSRATGASSGRGRRRGHRSPRYC